MTKKLILLVALAALTAPSVAQAPDPTQRVQFARGASSKTIAGSIKGYAGINYVVGVSAGQTMTVNLKTTGKTVPYFNIWAPGASEALYNSSMGESSYSFQIPSSGDYRVQVYQMRASARRNEVATYSLTIGVR